jgi:hypothetical protein
MSEHESQEVEEQEESKLEDLEVSDDDAEEVKGGGAEPHLR